MTGEILDGRLHTQPRRAWPHVVAASGHGYALIGPFQRGRGGPGGWWIVDEPELHFIRDAEVDVPNLAGLRRARMVNHPPVHRTEVVPDWVCEVLSPSTESQDCKVKMPIHARFGVHYAWLVAPTARNLEAYALGAGVCREIDRFPGAALVSMAPFEVVSINLGDLWVPAA